LLGSIAAALDRAESETRFLRGDIAAGTEDFSEKPGASKAFGKIVAAKTQPPKSLGAWGFGG